jgi:HlyD family secretion protein
MRFPFSRRHEIPVEGYLAANTKRKTRGKRRGPRLMLALVLLAGLVAAGAWWLLQPGTPAAATTINVPVTQGDLDINVESSGKVEASRESDVKFEAGGKVTEVLVEEGAEVTAGQPLVRLDDGEQRLAVQQAEAALRTAQTRLAGLKEGPSSADIAGAEADVQAARANLDKVSAGASAKDIADAEADLRSARAALEQLKKGATSSEIAGAEADLRAAQAALEQVKAGPEAEDVTGAGADLRAAQAKLDALKQPPAAADVAAAETALAAAEEKLAALKAGPTGAERSTAQLGVSEAEANLNTIRADYFLKKQQADLDRRQADRDLGEAQRSYGAIAYEVLDEHGNLTVERPDPRVDQYYEALKAMQDAEAEQARAMLALDDVLQKETIAVAEAQAKLDDARAQLADLLDGATAEELAAAQTEVSKAQAALDELNAGPDAGELADAEGAVAKAQAALDGLNAGPDNDALAEAEAAAAKAEAALAELKAGTTPDKVAEAQTAVDKAQNNLNDLQAGPSRAEVAEAEAAVAQKLAALQEAQQPASAADVAAAEEEVLSAQKSLDEARRDLEKTTLTAPFSGTVSAVSAEAKGQANAGETAVSIFDPKGMHLELEVSESDVEQVQVGQEVTIAIDALPDQTITGTVKSVSPVATSGQDVVTYRVSVQFDPGDLAVKVGMSANASILVERREGVLMVPNRALQTVGTAKSLQVLYGESQTPVTVRVKTGATNGQMTEIAGCLDTSSQCLREGDVVAMAMSTSTGNNSSGPGGDMVIFEGPVGGARVGGPGGGPIIRQSGP